MKFAIIISVMLMVLSSIVLSLDMCEDFLDGNRSCRMVTPSLSCIDYNYSILNISGDFLENGNLTLLNNSIYYFNFSKSFGDYVVKLCDGSTREIHVGGTDSMMLSMIFGISIVIALLIFIAFKLDESHWFLKIGLVLISLFMALLIPRVLFVYVQDSISGDFVRYYLRLIKFFVYYLSGYIVWKIADYYGKTSSIKRFFKDRFMNKNG